MNSNILWAPMPEPLTPDQINTARTFTAAHARDADDARMLLDMLGIGDQP